MNIAFKQNFFFIIHILLYNFLFLQNISFVMLFDNSFYENIIQINSLCPTPFDFMTIF